MPRDVACASVSSATAGVAAGFMTEQGQAGKLTVIETPADGVSALPESSKARLFNVTVPLPAAFQEEDHGVGPVPCRQVAPPSVETSTTVTVPPPFSTAVPLIV